MYYTKKTIFLCLSLQSRACRLRHRNIGGRDGLEVPPEGLGGLDDVVPGHGGPVLVDGGLHGPDVPMP